MKKIRLASWSNRFWAWLIDVLFIAIPWYMAAHALRIDPASYASLGYHGALMFFYWTFLEGYRGQSLGKMVLGLAVVGPMGESISFRDAAIESFGKAFLLPPDCLLGMLALPGSGQRLFNRISNTFVASIDGESLSSS
jgi:uncharacterized RDD family membrane protein YckC